MRKVRMHVGVACLAAATAIAILPGALGPTAAATAAAPASSAVTVSGGGPFSSLKVSVSQTRHLIDQIVEVDWHGAAPTLPDGGSQANYLQIMQCWGDSPSGPDRTQCEFGALSGTVDALPSLQPTREVYAGSAIIDPAEKLLPTKDNPNADVPFAPVHPNTGAGADNSPGQFYGIQTTNEVPFGKTQADGTGKVFFETQTTREAPGLGCGEQLKKAGRTVGRSCWLVIVPRGETEVNGHPYTEQGYGLVTSPLSATNWAQRIVVPLQFEPVGLLCPLGADEERTLGQEMAQEAVGRWQPTLCTRTGTAYGFTPVSDDTARAKLLTTDPGLEFVGAPEPPGLVPKGTKIAYAPVAISGAVIAFNVDVATYRGSPAALKARNGTRVPAINLTPRIVAKLITQSYRLASPALNPKVAKNQPNLVSDPDFVKVNPGLAGLAEASLADVLMPFTSSDAIKELWTWINADKDAKAFLHGAADPWGMKVNPVYKGVADHGAPNDFPKNDQYCQPPTIAGQTRLCTLDSRPYANDMHDAARSAARGDTLSRAFWDPTAIPPAYKKVPTQLSGKRAVMAFTDAATAARYSLPVAHLLNAAGKFVAPTAPGLAAGLAAMKPSAVKGVLSPNPTSHSAGAYPLTSITYAATVPAALTPASRKSLKTFVRYAVTAGQVPGLDAGQLPYGYLPLTAALSKQAQQMAASLTAPIVTATPTPTPTTASPKPTTTPTTALAGGNDFSGNDGTTSTGNDGGSLGNGSQPDSTSPTQLPTPTVNAGPTKTAVVVRTAPKHTATATPETVKLVAVATQPVAPGTGRYILLIIFVIGALCAFSGPLLIRLSNRSSR